MFCYQQALLAPLAKGREKGGLNVREAATTVVHLWPTKMATCVKLWLPWIAQSIDQDIT